MGQPRKVGKHRLNNIFRPMRIIFDQTQSRGIDQPDVIMNDFAECLFRGVSDIFCKQGVRIGHVIVISKAPMDRKSDKKCANF